MVSPTVQPSTKRNTSLNSPAKWRTVLLVWCLSHFQLLMGFFAGVIVIVTFSVTLPTAGEPQQTYHTTNVQTTAAADTVAAVTTAAVATTAATKDLLPRVGSETTSNPGSTFTSARERWQQPRFKTPCTPTKKRSLLTTSAS